MAITTGSSTAPPDGSAPNQQPRIPGLPEQQRYWDQKWSREKDEYPNAWAHRRGAIIAEWVRSLPVDRPKILDLGCGTGWLTEELAQIGPATGIDLSEETVALARSRYPHASFLAGNVLDMPLPSGDYDVVVSQEVIAHVEDQRGYMDRVSQVLKPDGYLIITTVNPFVHERSGWPPQPHGHIEQWLDRSALKRLLQPCFRVLRMTTVVPMGHRGILRLVNSPRLNSTLRFVIPQRNLMALKERAGLGWTRMALAQKRAVRRIALLAHSGLGNLGEEATMSAALQNIWMRRPNAEIVCVTARPDDSGERHKVPAFPIRPWALRPRSVGPATEVREGLGAGVRPQLSLAVQVKNVLRRFPLVYRLVKGIRSVPHEVHGLTQEVPFLLRSIKMLRGVDLLAVVGSSQLQDYFGGPRNYPLNIFQWAIMARLAGARLAFVSVGARPLRSPVSRRLLRCALSLADYRSVRDESSKRLVVEDIGARQEPHVLPDLVHSLRLPDAAAVASERRRSRIVGINPLPFFHGYWAERNDAVYQRYVETLADFAVWLMESGWRVLFFPTHLRADPPVIGDIEGIVKRSSRIPYEQCVVETRVASFEDLIAAIATTDIVVACRFHAVVTSYLLRTPVVGVAYQQKTEDLMRDMGQGDYVLDILALDRKSLINRVQSLDADLEKARSQIERRQWEYRQELARQYDRLFA
jgi:polysaccharide pyruvyl transferase WcaK-like protein/2-polyprenyl-3-methyl-5-hydroxy-6-metoxy-1,4-benzoquinol methylase